MGLSRLRTGGLLQPAPGAHAIWGGCVAFWKLEEDSGNDRVAQFGGFELAETGGVIARATGKLGYGVDFEADDSRLLLCDASCLHLTTFTIAGWAKMETKPAASGRWAARSNGAGKLVFRIGRRHDTDRAEFAVSTNGTSWGATCTTSLAGIAAGTWFFWASRYNDTTKKADLRVNTTDAVQQTLGGAINGSADAGVTLGALQSGGQYFDGVVDAVGAWAKVLTDAQLTTLYNSGTGREHPD